MKLRVFLRSILAVAVVLTLVAQTGCKKEPEPTIADGYVLFEEADGKFSMEYPENWLVLYDGADLEAIMSALIDAGDLAAADVVDGLINNPEELQGFFAWYDVDNAVDSSVPVMYLWTSIQQWLAQTGITSAVYINQLKEVTETSYPNYYPGFELLKEPAKATYGDNVFASFIFSFDRANCRLTAKDAYIDNNGYLLEYQIIIPAENFDKQINEYEKMLGSIKFEIN